MSQTVTLNLPDSLYHQVAQRAYQMKRTVEDELLAAAAAALPTLPEEQERALSQLSFLTNAELWQAARMSLPKQDSTRMQVLIDKQQSNTLTPDERQEAEALVHRAEHTMLIRAQAAVLLKQRGVDISDLTIN